MKQLGNLAMVCAQRSDVLLQIQGGGLYLHVGCGPQRESVVLDWKDDEKIAELVRELNFGCYQKKEEEAYD